MMLRFRLSTGKSHIRRRSPKKMLLLLPLWCLFVPLALHAQGINPISPPVNDLMEVVTPSAANPSRNYTTPMRLQSGGSAPTLSGSCSVLATTQKGGNAIGQFTIPSGNCATSTTITLTFATTAQFTIATTNASSGDIIQFRCAPY